MSLQMIKSIRLGVKQSSTKINDCPDRKRGGADVFGFPEEFGYEFGSFDCYFLFIGNGGVGVNFENWHCEGSEDARTGNVTRRERCGVDFGDFLSCMFPCRPGGIAQVIT